MTQIGGNSALFIAQIGGYIRGLYSRQKVIVSDNHHIFKIFRQQVIPLITQNTAIDRKRTLTITTCQRCETAIDQIR